MSARLLPLSLSRSRLLLLLLGVLAALAVLSACAEVEDSTTVNADGSGVQTLTVTVTEDDLESIDGGAAKIESIIKENNPGLTYEGMEKNGTDTVYTMTLEFSDAKDYAAKAQPVLEAGELTKTAEVTFVPPKPPFSRGYTMSRNFTATELTRWAAKAVVDAKVIDESKDAKVDELIDPGEVAVTVDGEELKRDVYSEDGNTVWTNAAAVNFTSVDVQTAVNEAGDAFTRTITYELPRETYLDAKEDFDAFFEEATPEGGELTPAGDAGTTWVIAFPEGSAENVATWTDTALATEGSVFTYEVAPSNDDPFVVETRVVDSIDCVVACGQNGYPAQTLVVGEEPRSLQGGPEPEVLPRTIGFTDASYDLTINRDGGGELVMTLTLSEADDAVVGEDNVIDFLGGEADRSTGDGVVTYTVTVEGKDAEEFTAALQKIGFTGTDELPVISVSDIGDGTYSVYLGIGAGEDLYQKLEGDGTWTIHGDGLRPVVIDNDEMGNASIGEESLTVQGHGVLMSFSAERTGLSPVAIVGILMGLTFLGLLIAAGVLGFLYREKIKAMLGFGSAQTDSAEQTATAGQTAAAGQTAQPTGSEQTATTSPAGTPTDGQAAPSTDVTPPEGTTPPPAAN